ncbi:hypothetical protein PCNPT3_09015 [Psychromonas sp. CNPT3]|uniref:DUF4381 domain-containing protein n=1 Tax=Psychromonas sp. CNPT3 TaxID=314282 RepID=UPI00006E615E|nr:DUF4381 domain-containing protein [Psychromonas sp. CNPT3]AGH81741.1 hypothetical protein PCNPT3_09015 [Psychromonas sp. CNPT3]
MRAQTSTDPLAQLADIISPTVPSSWPPAPLYWILLVIVFALLGGLFWYLHKQSKEWKKDKNIRLQLQTLIHQDASFIQLNQLLKAVALQHFPRHQVASLHGKAWFVFLHQYSQTSLFGGQQRFLQRLYKETHKGCSPDDFNDAKLWLNGLKKEIKKRTRNV